MKFKFNLEKVLSHRKTIENLAQIDFQEALALLKAEEVVLEKMKSEIVEARAKAYDIQTSKVMDQAPTRLQHIFLFIKGQAQKIKIQESKIQNFEKLVESHREILRSRVTESKILERLKHRKKSEFEKEQSRLEQIEADDMNLIRLRLREK
ncbi:MAG: flagellar export protein FliJ [Bdellovibrionales bacterium]|nr:flagellar export protein FliJ [Bdellovibrionales bacterium]